MGEVWMPGLIHDPGANAGYARGHNREEIVKVHYTAGTNSYGIGKAGYFQFLVPKEGTPWQFAEADALCWDSGDFNDDGPGVEFERMVIGGEVRPGLSEADPLTANQAAWGSKIFAWLHTERGYPLSLYDGPRFQTAGFRGFVNHGDIDTQRSDGLTRTEWNQLTTTTPQEDHMVKLFQSPSSIVAADGLHVVGLGPADLDIFITLYGPPAAVSEAVMQSILATSARLQTQGALSAAEIAHAVVAALPAPVDATDAADIEAAVAAVLNRARGRYASGLFTLAA